MFTSRVAIAAFAAAMLSIFAAPAANAYAPPPFTADAPENVEPGGEFTVTFDAGSINCAWTMTPFNGQAAPGGSGSTYTVTLTAPEEDGTYSITANCTWDSEDVNPASAPASSSTTVTPAVFSTNAAASDTLLVAPQTDAYTVQIVVGEGDSAGDNDSDDSNGALPNTGGSSATMLAIGAGLAVAGAGLVFAVRRRRTA